MLVFPNGCERHEKRQLPSSDWVWEIHLFRSLLKLVLEVCTALKCCTGGNVRPHAFIIEKALVFIRRYLTVPIKFFLLFKLGINLRFSS